MFLSTLREIIINKPECLKNYINILMPLYISQSNSDDEPIRNIVAESIGKLFIAHPEALSPQLEQAFQTDSVGTLATCAKSFKYSAHNNVNHQHFAKFVPILMQLLL
jgi:hypothetical protein